MFHSTLPAQTGSSGPNSGANPDGSQNPSNTIFHGYRYFLIIYGDCHILHCIIDVR